MTDWGCHGGVLRGDGEIVRTRSNVGEGTLANTFPTYWPSPVCACTKYRLDTANGDWHQYLTVYELASREVLDAYLHGEAVTRLRADHYNHFGHCTRLSRMILTPTAMISKPIG
jgi:hypothetical protein